MENTTKEKIKEIRRKLQLGELTVTEAFDQLEALCDHDGDAETEDAGPPAGGGGGGNPGGGNP
jgi:hypothetical protein